eukprot:2008675-Pleurochrysis_carterae.AAC.1
MIEAGGEAAVTKGEVVSVAAAVGATAAVGVEATVGAETETGAAEAVGAAAVSLSSAETAWRSALDEVRREMCISMGRLRESASRELE